MDRHDNVIAGVQCDNNCMLLRDMTTAEKIVTVLVSFVGTPLGYLFGYSTTKSAEVSAKEDINILREQIFQTSSAIEKLGQARQTDQEIISDLKVALERTRQNQ